MVIVILVMAVAIMVGGIAVADSVSGRQTSFRDLRSKHAQAAADNGIQQELYRANEANVGGLNFYNGLGGLTSTLVCNLGVATGTQLYVGGLSSTSTSVSTTISPSTTASTKVVVKVRWIASMLRKREMMSPMLRFSNHASGRRISCENRSASIRMLICVDR